MVEKYRSDLFRTVFAILRDQKEAEDAVQEVFIKIFNSLPNYENQGLKTWMTRIAVNHAIDMKRKRMRRLEDVAEVTEFLLPDQTTVEGVLLQKEQQQLVRERLKCLPKNYRDVIYGFYIDEKSYQQLADEQNVQVKTIEMKLYRARQWIKTHWEEGDFL